MQQFDRYPHLKALAESSHQLPAPIQLALGRCLLAAIKSYREAVENPFEPTPRSIGADAVLNLYKGWYNKNSALDRSFNVIAHLPHHRMDTINTHCGEVLKYIHLYRIRRTVSPRDLILLIEQQFSDTVLPPELAIDVPPELKPAETKQAEAPKVSADGVSSYDMAPPFLSPKVQTASTNSQLL